MKKGKKLDKPTNKESGKSRASTYVDNKVMAWIEQQAAKDKRTESAFIRLLLEEAYEKAGA